MSGKPNSKGSRGRPKGKRWAKGQSSSSNPTCNRFRKLAKSNVISYPRAESNSYQGNLTERAVKAHNDADCSISTADDDNLTVGSLRDDLLSGSFQINAFKRFFGKFNMQSNMHKQMLAILTAVRDIIKEAEGKESETEYFATLMTSLLSLETTDELAAAITLVNTIIRRVPVSILKSKFGEFSQIFVDLLSKHVESGHNVLIGQLTSSLGYLLQVQDHAEWQNSSTHAILKIILNFVSHSQPKIRKSARRTVQLIVGAERKAHPAAKSMAAYCIQQLESYSGTKSMPHILHVLNLLKEILGFFPQQQLKQTCETILRLMTLGNITIKTCSLMTFRALFTGLPLSENFPPPLTVQIINALHTYFPAPTDSNLMPNWLSVMEAGAAYLHNVDANTSWNMLPPLFEKGVKGWLSDSSEIHQAVASTLKSLLYKTLEPVNQMENVSATVLKNVQRLFNIIEECLKFQYHFVWDQVLHILAVFFEVAGKFSSSFMKKCLQTLSSLRESHHFAHTNKLDYAIGKAVKSMGPEVVLSAIPISVTAAERIDVGCPNSWIVPILRDNISHSTISFFVSAFLPLAISCQSIAKKFRDEGKIEAACNYELLHTQLWSCLPGFCNSPRDLSENFKTIAKTLGQNLSHQPQLRLDILAALRSVISCNLNDETNKHELMRFSKNYLPILMNLYTTEPDSVVENHVRLAVLETISVYLQITPHETCIQLFDKLIMKLEDKSSIEFMKQSAFDVARTMLAYIDSDRLEKLYRVSLEHTESYDRTVVKKCFRIFQELCVAKSDACEKFVKDCWLELKNLFSTLETGPPAVKAIKLRGLASILEFIPKKKCIVALVPKVISCVCEPSQKAKDAAFHLLEQILQHFINKKFNGEEETLKNFVDLMMQGLGVSTAMMGATVASVGFILKTFDEHVTDELINNVLEKSCLLLLADDRSVIRASIDFLIAIVSTLSDHTLLSHIKTIMENLMFLPSDVRKSFRPKIQQLLTKFIKRYGREFIAKHVPECHQRLITNLHKSIERKKRQQLSKALLSREMKHGSKDSAERKSLADLLEDSDDEDDERDGKVPTFLREKTDDAIVNFLDPASAQNIQSRPVKQRSAASKEFFPKAADGRFIIADDEEEALEALKDGKEDNVADEPDVNTQTLADELSFGQTSSKRKLSTMEEEEDEVVDNRSKAREIGIHRVVGTQKKLDEQQGMKYRAKKAKGDIKKVGQPDPYAYIPMDRSMLNKRQSRDQYKGLLQAARMGAKKGVKFRARRIRKL